MANNYIDTLASNNQPLRASLLQEIDKQAALLYIPAQADSALQGQFDPTVYPYLTVLSTGSTSYVDIPGFTVDLVTSGRRVLVLTAFHHSLGSSTVFEVVTVIDGVVQTNSNRSITGGTASGMYLITYHFMTDVLSAGKHTIKLQTKRLSGANTLGIYAAQGYRLTAREY